MHIGQRDRERLEHRDQDPMAHATKSEEIVFLEKQGRCSQKIRNNTLGNLAHISHAIGMTDISNIGHSSLSSTTMVIFLWKLNNNNIIWLELFPSNHFRATLQQCSSNLVFHLLEKSAVLLCPRLHHNCRVHLEVLSHHGKLNMADWVIRNWRSAPKRHPSWLVNNKHPHLLHS